MDIFNWVMTPIKWIIEAILVGGHWLLTVVGFSSESGIAWILSIVLLVVVVRSAMIPLTVRQIKSQRAMMIMAPELQKLQAKYKGKTDQFSREAMAREQQALFKKYGSNPLSSCLPMVVQLPIFFGLYTVLNEAGRGNSGVGFLTGEKAAGFAASSIFGAPMSQSLQGTLQSATPNISVVILAAILVILMVSTQFFTQLQIVSKNMSAAAKASPTYRQQRMLMYILPFAMVFSGIAFPLGVVFYWFVNNLWTMCQQYIVIRNMPQPGSEAEAARKERLRRKGRLVEDQEGVIELKATPTNRQRQQPVSKSRAKKQGNKPDGSASNQTVDNKEIESNSVQPPSNVNDSAEKPKGSKKKGSGK